VVDAISAELTTDQLIELNGQFDLENEDAEDIAAAWLEDHPIRVS
jgi:osmoprotectant transport system substrate-binding protein